MSRRSVQRGVWRSIYRDMKLGRDWTIGEILFFAFFIIGIVLIALFM